MKGVIGLPLHRALPAPRCPFVVALTLRTVVVAGNRLYVATDEGVIIFDVSSPLEPLELGLRLPVSGLCSAQVVQSLTLLIFFRHAANIRRLRSGTEPKIGEH